MNINVVQVYGLCFVLFNLLHKSMYSFFPVCVYGFCPIYNRWFMDWIAFVACMAFFQFACMVFVQSIVYIFLDWIAFVACMVFWTVCIYGFYRICMYGFYPVCIKNGSKCILYNAFCQLYMHISCICRLSIQFLSTRHAFNW